MKFNKPLRYRSIHDYGSAYFEEKKSKFLGQARPVESEEEAVDFINSIREEYKDATHNCTAYLIDNNLKRFDDDGEPSHTAGMPMLNTLEEEGLEKLVVVATRYFGGTLLGKGGLVRAYTQACKMSLEESMIVDKVLHTIVHLVLDYSLIGPLDNYLINNNIETIDKVYEDSVTYKIYSQVEKEEKIKKGLMDLSSGTVAWEGKDSLYLSMKDGKLIF